jgi:general secretion pathway protein M
MSRRRCILVWFLALTIPGVLVTAVAWPWASSMAELDREIATKTDQLQRYQRLLATLPGLRAELAQVQNNQDFKAFYYDAQTPALAGAQLQRELQQMVQAAGGRLISTQILPAPASDQPARVSVRTQLQGDTDALLEVLYRIEQARPFLFVDQVSVRSTSRRVVNRAVRGRRVPAAVRDAGQLTVRLDVFGYVLGASA